MKIIFLAFVAIIIANIIADGLSRDANVQLAIQLEKMNEEQRTILTRLEAKEDLKVSQFVADWRSAYPSTTSQALQELRLIEQKINNNVSSASDFTVATRTERQREFDAKMDATVSSPLSFLSFLSPKQDVRPGL